MRLSRSSNILPRAFATSRTIWIAFFGLALMAPAIHAQQVETWAPVAPAEIALKDNPASPGDVAMVLYREVATDDDKRRETHYERIKILKAEGAKYADIEIPHSGNMEVIEIRARTTRADGSVLPFNGGVFEKTLFKSKRFKVFSKSFTLPGVEAGSVIEYAYTISWKEPIPNVFRNPSNYLLNGAYTGPTTTWVLQRELFVRKVRFSLVPVKDVPFRWDSIRMGSWSPQRRSDGVIHLTVENIRPIPQEDHSPPAGMLTSRVHFYYTAGYIREPASFWADHGRRNAEELEQFMGKFGGTQKRELAAIINPADPAEVKLRKIYERVQKLRYLSYEPAKTEKELKAGRISPNKNVDQVLERGYAYANEINYAFLALVRGAGFQAAAVAVVSRESGAFEPTVLDVSQLDAYVIQVKVGNEDKFFDPASRFCPYGQLPWFEAGVGYGIRLDVNRSGYIKVPGLTHASAGLKRTAKFLLGKDGKLDGTVELAFTGQEALRRRVDAAEVDEAARKKSLEDELKGTLPAGSIVTLEKSGEWLSSEGPLIVQAKVEVPRFAVVAGQRLLLPGSVFHTNRKQKFQAPTREHPVYFIYPYHEIDVADIELAPGIAVEAVPPPVWDTYEFGEYKKKVGETGSKLRIEREFSVKGIIFATAYYKALQELYGIVAGKDNERLVLRSHVATK